jgi:hypothetical protein
VQGIKGPGADPPQVSFEFGEGHFDRIEIGAVGRQKQEPAASLAQCFGGALALVCGQVVEDDDGSGIKRRGQLRLDVGVEGGTIHRPFDHPRRDQGVLRQPGDKGLRAPFAKRCRAIEPLTDRGPSAQPREVGLDRRLVNKDQPVRLLAHAGLAAHDPIVTGLAERGPITLGCDQSFFYMTVRRVRARGAARKAAPPRHVFPKGLRPIP